MYSNSGTHLWHRCVRLDDGSVLEKIEIISWPAGQPTNPLTPAFVCQVPSRLAVPFSPWQPSSIPVRLAKKHPLFWQICAPNGHSSHVCFFTTYVVEFCSRIASVADT